MDAREKAQAIAEAIRSKKGFDIVILDVRERAGICDYFVVGSANNVMQTGAVAEKIAEDLEKKGEAPLRTEGARGSKWIGLDFSDVIVHVFERNTREEYRFEALWEDGTNRVEVREAAPGTGA